MPAVNIGRRQAGRAICKNVICCEGDAAAIEAAIRKALSPAFAAKAKTARSPYFGGDTSGKIVRVLERLAGGSLLAAPKPFYDGPVPEFDPLAEPVL